MLLLFFLPVILAQSYLSVPPIKLLTANLFGDLYPAANSEYRVSSTGNDQEVTRTELEEANKMPKQELILSPGGRAVYLLPTVEELSYLMVKPGKKEGGTHSPFSDKANITISAAWTEEAESVSLNCSRPSRDSSSSASRYCILELAPLLNDSIEDWLMVTLTVPPEETRDAAIWQLHLSPLDDSERVKGTFRKEGRQLMRKTQEEEETNTWLTMVSIVGNTGVGKSTLASLLSGNATMFKAKASNQGTTTIGADISPIILTDDYTQRMEDVLGQGPLFEPDKSRPLFLIDSEGMSFRGDEVDFVTTGPVAVIANIIVWITTGRLRPPDMLERIQEYMKGLDRITMGDENSDQQNYGEFIVVLNMMQEDDQGATDEEMCNELMGWGSSEEDDAIREEMVMRFKEIACIGLPRVDSLPINYTMLEKYPRFREGLFKLGNRILQESETPLDIKVGRNKYEMNSTEAETIIGMMIDAANEGNIDLSDICNVLFSMTKEKVIQKLAKVTIELQAATEGMCDNSTQSCTACVCDYRNIAVENTINTITESINFAIDEAESLCEDPSVKESIIEIIEDILIPWKSLSRCNGILGRTHYLGEICDIGELQSVFEEAEGEDLLIECSTLHICGKTFVHNSELSLNTSDIFISPGATLEQNAPNKAKNGGDGDFGKAGSDGEPGVMGKSMTLAITGSVLTGSEQNLVVTLRGGEGGDGGGGGDGEPGVPGKYGIPGEKGKDGTNGNDGTDGNIYDNAPDIGDAKSCSAVIFGPGTIAGHETRWGKEDHCCHLGDCNTYKYWQLFTWSYTATSPSNKIDGTDGGDGGDGEDGTAGGDGQDAVPGTKGGNGGTGGDGGEAGHWEITSPQLTLEVILQKIGGAGGAGGQPGKGGNGAQGGKRADGGDPGIGGYGGKGGRPGHSVQQRREWTAHKNSHERHHCNGWCTDCSKERVADPCSNFANGNFGDTIIAKTGKTGIEGMNGKNGMKGESGADGADAEAADSGNPGDPGQDATGCC